MSAAVAVPVPIAEQSDRDLVDRHRYGDPAAFEEIYRRFEEMVYNLALRMSGDPEEAADLMQEIFLRVFRHLGKFRAQSSLKTWIYRVALNHCRSRLARRRQRPLPLEQEVEERIRDPERSPEEKAMAGDAERLVSRALTQVKPAFREAVILRDLEGLSYQEIARVLRVRVGTVRSRIARGREQLRQLLEPGPEERV